MVGPRIEGDSVPRGNNGSPFQIRDPEPCADPVDGTVLLDDLAHWFAAYVYLPPHAADALALYVAATWFAEEFDFAPVLAVVSATKRCGKTTLLDVLKPVVRRGYATSGVGVTTAVLFRLNHRYHPTLLIDEAEKLEGRHADRDMIGMLNVGYRRGAKVQRCAERNGDYEVMEYDAFGFRVLAAIGTLWDTILDRAIVVRPERKPSSVRVRRFATLEVERQGEELARRLRRWSDDNRERVANAVRSTPRPEWLNDRECDHWAGMFAVAEVAGGTWLERAFGAARALSAGAEEQDHTELLLHDIWKVWNSKGWGEAVPSGDLARELNQLEGSPWGEYGHGRGLSPHRIASMLKRLGVAPRQDRTSDGAVVRGYWRWDLNEPLKRYPPPASVQVVRDDSGQSHVTAVPVVPLEAADTHAIDAAPRPKRNRTVRIPAWIVEGASRLPDTGDGRPA